MSSTTTPYSPSPLSDSPPNLMIPSINCGYTLSIETLEEEEEETVPNPKIESAIVELRIQNYYKLYMEIIEGHPPVTMDEDFLVSPKRILQFRVPLFLLLNSSWDSSICDAYVTKELESSLIDDAVAGYLKPRIIHFAVELAPHIAASSGTTSSEFKMIFDVKVVKIDLADKQEFDEIHSRGL